MSNVDSLETTNLIKEEQRWKSRRFRREPGMRFHEPYYELLKSTKLYEKWLYIKSYYKSQVNQELFRDVKSYCLFIGHGRSGHSIIGALLDAHPNMILADELDTLRYASAGFSKEQIFYLSLARSQRQARRGRRKRGREGKLYTYQVADQWQGRFEKLQVVGDSEAGRTVQRFGLDPNLLSRFQKNTMGSTSIKFIHIIRNPYDNISTFVLRGGRTIEDAADRYFTNCKILANLRKQIDNDNLLICRQEEFLAQPQFRLQEICHFLGLEVSQDYLDACASILYKSPSKSRHKVQWDPQLIETVQGQIDQFDFLAGYSYES